MDKNSLDLYIMTIDNECKTPGDWSSYRRSDEWKLIAIGTSLTELKLKVASRLIQRSTEIKSWDLFIVNGFADEKCFFLPIRDEVLVVYDEKFISPEEWVSIKEKHIHFLEDILVSDVYMRLHRLSIIDDRKWRLDRKEQQLVDRVDYHRKEVEVLQREIDNIHLEKENVE